MQIYSKEIKKLALSPRDSDKLLRSMSSNLQLFMSTVQYLLTYKREISQRKTCLKEQLTNKLATRIQWYVSKMNTVICKVPTKKIFGEFSVPLKRRAINNCLLKFRYKNHIN